MDSRLRGNDECRGSLAYSTAVEAHFRTNDEVVGWRAIAGPHHPRRFAKRPYSERMIWLMGYDIFVWDPKGARSV